MFEIGIGYPITLNEKTQFFDGFINMGYQQEDLRSSLFAGLFLSTQYRQAWRNDFSISSKLRVGKYLSDNYTMSVDAGYSLYSKRYKALSGLQLGLNFDRTNYYGFHIKYEEYKYGGIKPDRNLVLGIHLSDRKAKKIGLPIVGSAVGIVGLVGLFMLIVVGN